MKASFKGVPVLEYTEGLISYDWDWRPRGKRVSCAK